MHGSRRAIFIFLQTAGTEAVDLFVIFSSKRRVQTQEHSMPRVRNTRIHTHISYHKLYQTRFQEFPTLERFS